MKRSILLQIQHLLHNLQIQHLLHRLLIQHLFYRMRHLIVLKMQRLPINRKMTKIIMKVL